MLDDPIDICRVNGSKSHDERFCIERRLRDGNVIGVVEVADDACDEDFVDFIIEFDERLDTVEQFEGSDAIVGRNSVADRVSRAGGDAAVRLASDLEEVAVMSGFGAKHGIAPLD